MVINTWNQKRRSIRRFGCVIIVAVMMLAGFYQLVFATDAKQTSFKSPEEAVRALGDAVKGNDTKELLAIFGPEGNELVSSGDKVADEIGRENFITAYDEMNKLVNENDTKVILHVGKGDWSFPIPIIKRGEDWLFDTMGGGRRDPQPQNRPQRTQCDPGVSGLCGRTACVHTEGPG